MAFGYLTCTTIVQWECECRVPMKVATSQNFEFDPPQPCPQPRLRREGKRIGWTKESALLPHNESFAGLLVLLDGAQEIKYVSKVPHLENKAARSYNGFLKREKGLLRHTVSCVRVSQSDSEQEVGRLRKLDSA